MQRSIQDNTRPTGSIRDNPLSNFFPCDLRVFGEHHKTAEHAYQLTKAIRSGNTDAAQKVRDAETALDAKRIGNSVKDPQGWSDDKETVMEEIVTAKADQIAEVKAVLEKLDGSITFAEGTFDMFWGTDQYQASITTTEPLDLKLRPIITVEADDATQENMENIRALFLLNFPVNDDEQTSATETRDQSESDEVVD
uniref:NADAR domain-containing protein n=1 Tax=Magallana gigas TaxID=29159 RepID=A0A8W8IRP6_MAGGI